MKTHVYLQMHMKNVHKKNAKKSQNKKKNENLKVQRKNANGTTRRRNTAPNVSENGVTHSVCKIVLDNIYYICVGFELEAYSSSHKNYAPIICNSNTSGYLCFYR